MLLGPFHLGYRQKHAFSVHANMSYGDKQHVNEDIALQRSPQLFWLAIDCTWKFQTQQHSIRDNRYISAELRHYYGIFWTQFQTYLERRKEFSEWEKKSVFFGYKFFSALFLSGHITNLQSEHTPIGFKAQLVEYSTGPVRIRWSLNFFKVVISQLLLELCV